MLRYWIGASVLAVAVMACPVGHAQAAVILAYEGFATDATGSGDNYEAGEILGAYGFGGTFGGVDKPRTGFTGPWYDSNGPMSSGVNATAELGSLTYPGFITQDDGHGRPFRSSGNATASKHVGRDLDYTMPAGATEYYAAVLIDFESQRGGAGFGSRDNAGRYNIFDATEGEIRFRPPGDSADSYSTPWTEGTHLFVVRYFVDTDTPGNPNSSFYDRWELWHNPEITGPTLPTPTASGWGIGLKYGGGGNIIPNDLFLLDASHMAAGQSAMVDEFYIATDPAAFLIPEPASAALLGLGGLALLARRRR